MEPMFNEQPHKQTPHVQGYGWDLKQYSKGCCYALQICLETM